jgi:hypothetical protein
MKRIFTLIIIALLFSGVTRAQERTSLSVKDLNSSIEKYIKKNFKDYKIMEAYKYDVTFEIKIQKADAKDDLVFDSKAKFLYKKAEADKLKVSLQTRSTMSLKDVDSDIQKYIKKNFDGYKITEAFKYDEVYTTKIKKGAETETLLFDKDGNFEMKVAAAKPAEPVKKADSVPAKEEKKEEPKKADTTKK